VEDCLVMIHFALTTLKDRLERFWVFKKSSFSLIQRRPLFVLFDGCLMILFSMRVEVVL
jgi:hypothetical protein